MIPIDIADLRKAGRTPTLPFCLTLGDGEVLQVNTLLRLLPGKRLVGAALWRGQPVLAKIFLALQAERHGERERSGIAALHAAGLPTPELLHYGALPEGGFVVLTSWLADAQSIADDWAAQASPSALLLAMQLLGRMHAQGLVQEDLHLDNFLRQGELCWVIDGDGVHRSPATLENLALLLAQLPPAADAYWAELLAAYAQGGGAAVDLPALHAAVERRRQTRLHDFLKKTLRDCTQFAVRHSPRRFCAVLRDEASRLQAALGQPDAAMQTGRLLKDGGTCSVASAEIAGQTVVFKRYNLKHWRHALSRAWRPSRAWHSWQEAHRLLFYGIATPKPLALLEERLGPLRGRAFLLTEYCLGENLLTLLKGDAVPDAPMAEALIQLFAQLHALHISHGDLKATNLLWHQGQVVLIDLDAMRQHRSAASHARAWRRDRARLLRNWPANSVLHGWLAAHLPPG